MKESQNIQTKEGLLYFNMGSFRRSNSLTETQPNQEDNELKRKIYKISHKEEIGKRKQKEGRKIIEEGMEEVTK